MLVQHSHWSTAVDSASPERGKLVTGWQNPLATGAHLCWLPCPQVCLCSLVSGTRRRPAPDLLGASGSPLCHRATLPGGHDRWGGSCGQDCKPPTARGSWRRSVRAPETYVQKADFPDGWTDESLLGSLDLSLHRWAISAVGGTYWLQITKN